jgi:uncharacterized repeat protein (TIGR03803 family)
MTKLKGLKTAWAVSLLCAASAIASPAQTFNTLASFDGADGTGPDASLVQGRDGNLYGTTQLGGGNGSDSGAGTVYEITPEGKLTALYSFCAQQNCADGQYPEGLVLGSDGNFYGTTQYSGGTIFKVTPKGNLTTLYTFCPQDNCTGAYWPSGPLVESMDGNFYGLTSYGGNGSCGEYSCGTAFKITRAGVLTVVHNFEFSDGAYPVGSLVLGGDGNFYGVTEYGGDLRCYIGDDNQDGCGVVFKMSAAGDLTVLHTFKIYDGSIPIAGLVQGTDGNFYGMTREGGDVTCNPPHGCGTIFTIARHSGLTTLFKFRSSTGPGPSDPSFGALIQGTDGNLFGTTGRGGVGDVGTIFRITPGGSFTELHSFDGADGAYPFGGLRQATNGIFYGTAGSGGANLYDGTVFSLDTGLGAFVTFVRGAGKVGQTGGILGQGFTGTTSVLLNEVPASFTVVSDTYIRATVPAGATTGYVTVTTPGGTLKSNVPFRVIR